MRRALGALCWAGSSLALGTAVYLFVRPEASSYLQLYFDPVANPYPVPGLGSLPSLSHAFGFTLLSSLALGINRKTVLFSAGFWLLLELIFEFAQHPAVQPLTVYRGTFDPLDVVGIVVGVSAAALVARNCA